MESDIQEEHHKDFVNEFSIFYGDDFPLIITLFVIISSLNDEERDDENV